MKTFKNIRETTKQHLHAFTLSLEPSNTPNLDGLKKHNKFIRNILGKIRKHKVKQTV